MTGGRAWAGEWQEIKAPGRIQRKLEPLRPLGSSVCAISDRLAAVCCQPCKGTLGSVLLKSGGTCNHRCLHISREKAHAGKWDSFCSGPVVFLYFLHNLFYCLLAMISMLDGSAATFSAWWGNTRKNTTLLKCDGCVMKSWRIRVVGCKLHGCIVLISTHLQLTIIFTCSIQLVWTCSRSKSTTMGLVRVLVDISNLVLVNE